MPLAPPRPARHGFTVLELLLAVVLVGTLAALALVRFGDTKEKAYVDAEMNDLRNLAITQELELERTGTYAAVPESIPGHQYSPDVFRIVSIGTGTRWFTAVGHRKSRTICSLAVGDDGDGKIHCPGYALDPVIAPLAPAPGDSTTVSAQATLDQLDTLDAALCPYTGQQAPCPFTRRFKGAHVRWTFGDGTPDVAGDPATTATVRHAYATAGEYPVTLTVTTVSGHTLTGRRTVFAGVPVRSGATTVPAGGGAGGGGAAGLGWGDPGGFVGTPVRLASSGAVALWGSGGKAGAGTPYWFAAGRTTTSGRRVTSYRWDFGDGAGWSAASPDSTTSHTYAQPGTYTVTVETTDEDGTVQTTTTLLTCRPSEAGEITLAMLPAAPDAGTLVQFAAVVTGTTAPITRYAWTFGDGGNTTGADSTATHTYPTPGQYVVRVTITDAEGFSGFAEALVPVSGGGAAVDTTPAADVRPVAYLTVTPQPATVGQPVILDGGGSVAIAPRTLVRYAWDFGDFTAPETTSTPTVPHTYAATGELTARLIVTDSDGAADTADAAVTVLAAVASRRLYAWGNNQYGQLGDGTRTTAALPTPSAAGHEFVQVVAGGSSNLNASGNACGLDPAGAAWCWGDNAAGQLGLGYAGDPQPTPALVTGGHQFTALAIGENYACGLDTAGEGWCWGADGWGTLGDGTVNAPSYRAVPARITGGHQFVQLTASRTHACGLDRQGAAWCWGVGSDGQRGDSSTVSTVATPVRVVGGHTFTQLAAGFRHTCGLDETGTAWCWGSNANGRLGIGGTTYGSGAIPYPRAVASPTTFVQLSAAGGTRNTTCGVSPVGAGYCWGEDYDLMLGQGLGNETASPVENRALLIVGGHVWTEIRVGWEHVCGIDTARAMWCWGRLAGLGGGSPAPAPGQKGGETAPILVRGNLPFGTLAAGNGFTLGVTR